MFLGLVFWQWLLVAVGCFVVAMIGVSLSYSAGYKSIVWYYLGQIIIVIGSICTSLSGFIGLALLVLTIVKSFS
ncbi:hypothetical protein [Holdemanella porci]|uniref:hypothetical protein n=1 Tax=Holdemanella porci TaxID=2652276 RepID=UPI003AB4D7E9